MTTRQHYQATAAASLPVDRYQARPAKRKRRPGCGLFAGVLLALLLAAGAAWLAMDAEALTVILSLAVIVGIPAGGLLLERPPANEEANQRE